MSGSFPPPPRVGRFALGPAIPRGDHGVFRVVERSLGGTPARSEPGPGKFAATIECSDWCNIVAVTEDLDVVLIYQHRFGTDSITLEIPGGAIDVGETPLDAAKRELLEETGYVAPHWEPLAEVHPNPAIQGNRCYSFLATGARCERAPSFDEHESCELVLVEKNSVARLLDGAHVTHALAVLALERSIRKWGNSP